MNPFVILCSMYDVVTIRAQQDAFVKFCLHLVPSLRYAATRDSEFFTVGIDMVWN